MNIIKKYKPKHYDNYYKKVIKITGKYKDINGWLKYLSIDDMLVWLKTLMNAEKDNSLYLEENFIFITLVIYLFILELDVEENGIKLTNKEIINLIKRFEFCLNAEYSYRTNITNERLKYTLLKNLE